MDTCRGGSAEEEFPCPWAMPRLWGKGRKNFRIRAPVPSSVSGGPQAGVGMIPGSHIPCLSPWREPREGPAWGPGEGARAAQYALYSCR